MSSDSREDIYSKMYNSWLENARKMMSSFTPNQRVEDSNDFSGSLFPNLQSPFSFNQSFFEKMFWFPPFSLLQGIAGPYFTWYKDYLDLISKLGEINQEWMSLQMEYGKALVKISSSFSGPLHGKDAYNLWVAKMADGMDEILRNQEFASKMSGFLSKVMEAKTKSDLLLDHYFKMLGLPTRSDMDRVYKEIYLLKKKIRAVENSDRASNAKN